MKNKLPSLTLVALVAIGEPAQAFLLDPYVGLALGTATDKVKTPGGDTEKLGKDTSYSFQAGVAFGLVPLFKPRVEAEWLNLSSSTRQYDSTLKGFGVNGFVDLPIMPIIKPYIGVGFVGLKQEVKIDDGNDFNSDTKRVPQYMVGLDLDIPAFPVAGGIEYRRINAKLSGSDGEGTLDNKVNVFLAKLRIQL